MLNDYTLAINSIDEVFRIFTVNNLFKRIKNPHKKYGNKNKKKIKDLVVLKFMLKMIEIYLYRFDKIGPN